MADKLGFSGKEIMFSSNNTPADEFVYARELGQPSIWTPMKTLLS